MKKIFDTLKINSRWKKITLKGCNSFYLTAIKKNKNVRGSTLDKDCAKSIKFEIAIDSGKYGKFLTHTYANLTFGNHISSDLDFNNIAATLKIVNCPSTFYIRPVEITGNFSTVTEGKTSIEVYLNTFKI